MPIKHSRQKLDPDAHFTPSDEDIDLDDPALILDDPPEPVSVRDGETVSEAAVRRIKLFLTAYCADPDTLIGTAAYGGQGKLRAADLNALLNEHGRVLNMLAEYQSRLREFVLDSAQRTQGQEVVDRLDKLFGPRQATRAGAVTEAMTRPIPVRGSQDTPVGI